MKCPKCGQAVKAKKLGRPRKLDDKLVRTYHRTFSTGLAETAKEFGVTRGAVQASLKRSK